MLVVHRLPGHILVATIAGTRRHEVAVRLGRGTHTVVANVAVVRSGASVIELRRQPRRWSVAGVTRGADHQVARRHARATLAIVTSFALTRLDADVVKSVAQHAAADLAVLQVRTHTSHIGRDHRFTHHRTANCAKTLAVAVTTGVVAIIRI